ncbi:hypothetical protein Cgig2_006969 [Carnegiea gigantea]|uniref:Uncharacterized protein n=1 Tax=Carnegiea gigantea TaxID=171969 RepID=A0A9Q1KCS7_9CARY|nr:hypothetical protein Cgig2_006969 [Carnegiea gigantea]
MVAISNVDLDRYQMIDLHRDAYVEGRKCGVDVSEYFGFVFCPPGSQKKLPLQSDEDWRKLPLISPLPSQPQPEAAQPEPQLLNLTVDLSAYLFYQTTSTSQPEVPSLDAINVGLGGLEAYDLRDLSQPKGVSDYDYDREFRESSSSGNGESDSNDSVDPDFDIVDVQEGDGEEECTESLVDSYENGSNDGSDVDEIENVDVGDEIPRHIDAEGEDDDGNPTKNGLVKGFQDIFPECKRRICDVHYYRNFSTEYPGAKLYMLFWTACNASNKHVDENTLKKAKTTEGTSSQPTTGTPSSSQPVTAQPSSRAPHSSTRQTRSQTISANATRRTRSQTKQA